ncbi:hypothetical protein BC332_16917 [Capsicum chinense]|nr:hypothetical protein BC332_16917 [Capsicum chinense]
MHDFYGALQRPLDILVDTGSSRNFIDPEVVKQLECPTKATTLHLIATANGNGMKVNNMKIIKWTSCFKPENNENPASIWTNFPWHHYVWDDLCRIVEPIGTRLAIDKATSTQTRPATAKIKVEIDLTKPLVNEILLEIRNKEGYMIVITQVVEYETIPETTSKRRLENIGNMWKIQRTSP